MTLRRFIVERDIAKVGTFERDQLRGAAQKSNEVLRQLGPDIQWVESFVAGDKTFCVYMAVVGSIILCTSVIFVAGKPLISACLLMIASSLAM